MNEIDISILAYVMRYVYNNEKTRGIVYRRYLDKLVDEGILIKIKDGYEING